MKSNKIRRVKKLVAKHKILLIFLLLFPSTAFSENLSVGMMRFGSNCFGLSFSKPDVINNRLEFNGYSAVGWAFMTIENTSQNIDVSLTGAKKGVVKTKVEDKEGFQHLYVQYLYEEGVCNFDFPIFGFSQAKEILNSNEKTQSKVDKRMDLLNTYKSICKGMGFSPNTEEFGNCLLNLIED